MRPLPYSQPKSSHRTQPQHARRQKLRVETQSCFHLDIHDVTVLGHMVLLGENQTLSLRVKAWPACAASHLLDPVTVVFCPTGHACNRAVLFGWTHNQERRKHAKMAECTSTDLDGALDDDKICRQVCAHRQRAGCKEAEERPAHKQMLHDAPIRLG